MAFPGGMGETNESAEQTALRETHEEVGISPENIDLVGVLPGLWTVTSFWITPVVGILKTSIDDTPLVYSPMEIAEAFWIPLSVLEHPDTYRQEWIELGSLRYATHVYQVGSYRIWGATGAMIKNLLDRLAAFK
jgi:8-oxo-dGTP pyrophosphatase MutT (NUDIX family)